MKKKKEISQNKKEKRNKLFNMNREGS